MPAQSLLKTWVLFLTMPGWALGDAAGNSPGEEEILARAEVEFRKGLELTGKPREARQAFARAAGFFAQLQERGVNNPALYQNLGNGQFLSGNLAGAILSYHRGLRLAPHDPALAENLEHARSRVAYPPGTRPAASSWPPWLPGISFAWFLIPALGLYGLAWVALARRLAGGKGMGWMVFWLAGSAFLGGIWGWSQWQARQEEQQPLVVVAAQKVLFHRGNGENYPQHEEIPLLQPGMEARRLARRGDWLQIRLFSGHIGWSKREAVLVDEP